MNIMIISDVHANFSALQLFDAELKAADAVLCLGDIVGYHSEVNEVIHYLRQLPRLICIMGNHDDFLLRGCPELLSPHVKQWIDYADQVIEQDNRLWLASLPISWSGYVGNLSFMLVHGSPWRPFTDYLYADNKNLYNLDAFQYDIICFGQTHRAFIRDDKSPILLNPGSIGQSRDKKGIAFAMHIQTETKIITRLERAIL